MYPDIDQFIMTIYFIKDGGPYTLAFTRDDIEETKEMLRKRFESIRDSKVPQLKKSWKCTKICHFGKNDHPSGIINPETGIKSKIKNVNSKLIKNIAKTVKKMVRGSLTINSKTDKNEC